MKKKKKIQKKLKEIKRKKEKEVGIKNIEEKMQIIIGKNIGEVNQNHIIKTMIIIIVIIIVVIMIIKNQKKFLQKLKQEIM